MPSDGSIVFNTKIDNSNVEKDLRETKHKIEKANKEIAEAENAKMPLLEDAKKLGVELDIAKEKLAQLQAQQEKAAAALSGSDPAAYIEAAAQKPQLDLAVASQQKEVDQLQKKWDKINDKVDKYDKKISDANATLAEQTEKAGQLSAQLTKSGDGMAKAVEKVNASTKKIRKRLLSLALSALVFSAISEGLRDIREYMGNALRANEKYAAQLAKLKGALLTAFQPIYEAALPALLALMDIGTKAATVIGHIFAIIAGKSYEEMAKNAKALYEQAKATEKLGKSAEKAQRSLTGFDEIQKLSASGETDTTDIVPDFSISHDTPAWISELAATVGELRKKLNEEGTTAGNVLNNLATACNGLKAAAEGLWNWLDEHDFGEWATDQLEITSKRLAALSEMLAGLVTGDWNRFWNGLKMGAEAGWEDIANTFGGNKLRDAIMGNGVSIGEELKALKKDIMLTWDDIGTYLSGKAPSIHNTVVGLVNKLISATVSGVNYIARALNTIKVTFPDWAILGELRGKSYGVKLNEITAPQIPYLAQGAVIPPNREFMAVLGDQNNGYNLEGPESMFRSIVREEIAAFLSDMMTGFEAVVNEQKNTQDIIRNIDLGDTTIGQAAGRYNSKMNTARGGA